MTQLPTLSTPKYELTLPSSGDAIPFRPYLVKEEKVLMIAIESGDPKEILRATKSIVTECTFNTVKVNEIPLFDLEYIFLQLRAKSVGEVSTLGIRCPECNLLNKVNIDLNEVKVTGGSSNKLALDDTYSVEMTYPTADLADLLVGRDNDPAAAFEVIGKCLKTLYTKDSVWSMSDVSNAEVQKFLESLSRNQFMKIKDWFENMPRLAHKIKLKCSKCGAESEIVIQGLTNFFS